MNTNIVKEIATALHHINLDDLSKAEKIIYDLLKSHNVVCERGGEVELTLSEELNCYYDDQELLSRSQELPEDF